MRLLLAAAALAVVKGQSAREEMCRREITSPVFTNTTLREAVARRRQERRRLRRPLRVRLCAGEGGPRRHALRAGRLGARVGGANDNMEVEAQAEMGNIETMEASAELMEAIEPIAMAQYQA